jgi:hypothetical protein
METFVKLRFSLLQGEGTIKKLELLQSKCSMPAHCAQTHAHFAKHYDK